MVTACLVSVTNLHELCMQNHFAIRYNQSTAVFIDGTDKVFLSIMVFNSVLWAFS